MNIGYSKIGKISPVFFPVINLRYADGNCLKNILVVVTITPGQLITINSSQRKKSRNLTKCVYSFCTYFSSLGVAVGSPVIIAAANFNSMMFSI